MSSFGEEGGAPELLDELNTAMFGVGGNFPPPDAQPGYLTRITIEKVGGVGPWASLTAETAVVEKPAQEDEHDNGHGHHH